MQYMIVNWDGKNWIILHYSHNLSDAHTQMARLRQTFPECVMMANFAQMQGMVKRDSFLEVLEKMRANQVKL